MDSLQKLSAPRPVKKNPFLIRGAAKLSYTDKRRIYRNSERVKSENIFSNPGPFNDNLFDEVEKDFSEIDAKSEIFSILHSDVSFTSSFMQRDSVISNSTLDFNEVLEEQSISALKPDNSKTNIRS